MSVESTSGRRPRSGEQRRRLFSPWLDVVAISAWGILLLKYWLTGKLSLLIHPNYTWLAIAGGIGLLLIGGGKALTLLPQSFQRRNAAIPVQTTQHLSLFPPGWSSTLLLFTAILGFVVTPRAFASQTAIQRGVGDAITLTRAQPQAFRASSNSESRSLIEWVRTLNVYPEPDAYTGQKVKVQGFVIHAPELPEQYFLLSRFVITCCAADAYPVSLPVKLKESRKDYPVDTWLEIEGQMITEDLAGKRQLTIQPKSIKKIPEPKNPYDY
ncbi:TIGR03943 family protein [Trichocoleus sp. FACHB-591]|uniref:TIGR03943 family putative permease subunit n=1 Tax=Trichocoleus sp. FACHB-591 TaxID=2692872 RepID=UPI00168304C6|nr:TIGR03943 family protein [Trichocoleus sp. FACHB-591]MBD2094407.1 TIGR03943 family protein [Trichocoleus sp. FACHB-591]